MTAVAIFFNVALIHCALRAHRGRRALDPRRPRGGGRLLPQILGWALVATTIGIVLNMITDALKEYLGFLGGLLGGLLEFSWAVITYFVVPVLVTEKVGPITAVKRSASILRAKWGELLAGEARIGLLGMLFFLLSALIFAGGARARLQQGRDGDGWDRRDPDGARRPRRHRQHGGGATLSTIFQSGVYIYATTGQVPAVARSRSGRKRVPAEGEEVISARFCVACMRHARHRSLRCRASTFLARNPAREVRHPAAVPVVPALRAVAVDVRDLQLLHELARALRLGAIEVPARQHQPRLAAELSLPRSRNSVVTR